MNNTEKILSKVNLRFTTDSKLGFTRKKVGKKFKYFDVDGKLITDRDTIERIIKLAIPPAYKNVWICPYKNGHLQATGYDAKGRKQYRYHPLWSELSQQQKFTHLIDFAYFLPKIRKRVKKDIMLKGMPKQKIIAAVIYLLENTLIRVGNEEYEKDNKSYGLTTLKNRHASIRGIEKVQLQFKGKSGVFHKVKLSNKKIANIIKRCKELPGQDLFEYIDDTGNIQNISSYDINNYLKEVTGSDITAKDFRTWGGTVLAASALDRVGVGKNEKLSKKNLLDAIKKVSEHLRNKPNTCKRYYIHPSILSAYAKGYVISNFSTRVKIKKFKKIPLLDDCESRVVAILKHMFSVEKQKISHSQVAI